MKTFYIEQFGCRATQADGAAIERQLRDRGFSAAGEPAVADVVIVNTCTVTAAADSQARDAVRKIHARNPHARVIVTGCYAQRAPEELARCREFRGWWEIPISRRFRGSCMRWREKRRAIAPTDLSPVALWGKRSYRCCTRRQRS